MGNLTASEIGKMGGQKTIKTYDAAHFKKIGAMSKDALLKKYGPDYYKQIRRGIKPKPIA